MKAAKPAKDINAIPKKIKIPAITGKLFFFSGKGAGLGSAVFKKLTSLAPKTDGVSKGVGEEVFTGEGLGVGVLTGAGIKVGVETGVGTGVGDGV